MRSCLHPRRLRSEELGAGWGNRGGVRMTQRHHATLVHPCSPACSVWHDGERERPSPEAELPAPAPHPLTVREGAMSALESALAAWRSALGEEHVVIEPEALAAAETATFA